MLISKFENVLSWQKSKELAIYIYKLFDDSRDFGFRDQIQRAVISISNNIAEGFERASGKELRYFLYIAKGSCGEVRSMANIALELNYISRDQFNYIISTTLEISRLLGGFIKKIDQTLVTRN
jgi:four helix bundle protein